MRSPQAAHRARPPPSRYKRVLRGVVTRPVQARFCRAAIALSYSSREMMAGCVPGFTSTCIVYCSPRFKAWLRHEFAVLGGLIDAHLLDLKAEQYAALQLV